MAPSNRREVRLSIIAIPEICSSPAIGRPKLNIVKGAEAAKRSAHAIGVRPEHIALSTDNGTRQGTIGVSDHIGSDTFSHVAVDDLPDPLTVRADGVVELSYHSRIFLFPDPMQIPEFDYRSLRVE